MGIVAVKLTVLKKEGMLMTYIYGQRGYDY